MSEGDPVEVWTYGAWRPGVLLKRSEQWSHVKVIVDDDERVFWAANRFVREVEVN